MIFGAPDFITSLIVLISVLLGFGNIFILGGLLYIYWGSFREIKSEYTAGLMFFASVLMLQNVLLTSSYFINALHSWVEGIPSLLIILLEFIALFILLKISWE